MISSSASGVSAGQLQVQVQQVLFQEPLRCLPLANEIFRAWEYLFALMVQLIQNCTLRTRIMELPNFPYESLKNSLAQSKRAYVILSFLSHAYIQGSIGDSVLHELPDKLAIPFVHVSEYCGMKPVISYAATCLFNWRKIDESLGVDADNLAINATFSGLEDEKWFYLIPLKIDSLSDVSLAHMKNAIQAYEEGNFGVLEASLEEIRGFVAKAVGYLETMRGNCDPVIFKNEFRRFLNGSSDDKTWPEGILMNGKRKKLLGASAAQSIFVNLMDSFLGAVHKTDLLKQMREMVPQDCQSVINEVGKSAENLRKFIKESDNENLKENWDSIILQMAIFRQTHMNFIPTYIISNDPLKGIENCENRLQESAVSKCPMGTGGSRPMVFLRETLQATISSAVYPKSVHEKLVQRRKCLKNQLLQ